MNKSKILGIVLILIILYGCAPSSKTITFENGIKRISEINEKFGVGMKTAPNSAEEINEMLAELTGFAALNENMPKSLEYLIDFKIKALEAEKLHIEGWQWGRASTTDYGFGCRKGSARILNSSSMRNASAQKGYEAINALQLLIEEFPDKAQSANLTQKDVLFLNAEYYKTEEKARKDANIINSLCKEEANQSNVAGDYSKEHK